MNLGFDVLWCEDNEVWYEQRQAELLPVMEEVTHLPVNVKRIETFSEIENENPDDYDLFIVDYNLNSDGNGADVIKFIRGHSLCPTIVFYSSNSELQLREIVRGNGLDGVYVAQRQGDSLKSVVAQVSHITVKKMLDVNAIRGAFLSEVATIESKIDKLIQASCLALDGESPKLNNEAILSKYKAKIIKHLDAQKKEQEKKIVSIKTLCESHSFDLYKKSYLMEHILEEIVAHDETGEVAQVLGEMSEPKQGYAAAFQNEVINVRNPLAHQSEQDVKALYETIAGVESGTSQLFAVLDLIQARLQKHTRLLEIAFEKVSSFTVR